jgi:inositol phosphorylceramide mannosyltransferase catalytic subunit
MNFFGPRARRVLDALTDYASYRLLYSSVTNGLMSLEGHEADHGSNGELGLPSVEPVGDRATIPKIIFQTWKSHYDIPANFRYWRRSFLVNNPDFRCFLWDDADNLRFIETRFPWFLARFQSYSREIYRVDVVRLFFLYTYGGFYADMDSECLKPLDSMRNMGDVLVGRMGSDSSFEHSIPNAIMASKSKQAFWLLAIAFAVDRLQQSHERNDSRPEWLTGPVLLKDAVDFYMSHSQKEISNYILKICPELLPDIANSDFGTIKILPPSIWYPVNWNNFIQTFFRNKMSREKVVLDRAKARRIFPRAFIVTYWSASWKSASGERH